MKSLSNRSLLFIIGLGLIAAIFAPSKAKAGSCCGGGSSSAQIMTGPTKGVFRTSYQNRSILADVGEQNALARKADAIESIETMNFSASLRTGELWQIGFSAPIVRKTRSLNDSWESSQGLGDVKINAAYEFYPEYSRNQILNNAFVFLQATLPTAPSIFTVNKDELLDSRGEGHYQYAIGTLALKRLGSHNFQAQALLSFRPGRKFSNTLFSDEEISTKDSLNHTLELLYTYDLSNTYSVFTGASRAYTQRRAAQALLGSEQLQREQSSTLHQMSFGFLATTDTWDFLLTYQDDFLLSDAGAKSANTILGKAVSFGAIKRLNL